jgi:hypothetical protein
MPDQLIPLNFLPGTQRDGTQLDGDRAIDALWTRWRLGRPRKMGGYTESYSGLKGIGRRVHMFYQGNQTIVHIGTGKSLQQVVLDAKGNLVSVADRTPATFAAGPNAGWTLDALFDTTSNAVQLAAHSVPDISVVAGVTQTTPFIGDITKTDKLIPLNNPLPTDGVYTQPKIAGGVVAVQPYLFDYDINGSVGWSAPNLPNYLGVVGGTSGAGRARVSAQKIVAGIAQRGGGVNSPAALFWSLSEVITAQFVGSANGIFAFNTVSPSSSILSPNTVVEYDGLYMWAGVDRFLMYNGTVVEIPNNQNLDYFFDNINRSQAGKSFVLKIPRYGEVWFCAPLFGATECSHAIIFNLRENCWYDTELPDNGRSAGYFAQGFRYPVMTGNQANGEGNYSLWLHERGLDEIRAGARPLPIRSYVETPYIGSVKNPQPDSRATSFEQLEPDIVQSGDMLIYAQGGFNAKSGISKGADTILPAVPKTVDQQVVAFKDDFRLGSIHFESNCLGGNFIMGKSILHTTPGPERYSGSSGTPLTNPSWLVSDTLEELVSDVKTPVTKG